MSATTTKGGSGAVASVAPALPAGTEPVRAGGLLAGVRRACAAHGRDAACVGSLVAQSRQSAGGLVFWCPAGHHFTR